MKKLSCGKLSLAFGRDQLSFLEYVHEQDALQGWATNLRRSWFDKLTTNGLTSNCPVLSW